MTALHSSAHMTHAAAYVAASLVIAIAASELALWLATGQGGRQPMILSAVAFGVAVSGMHYTAMAGMTLLPHSMPLSGAPALSTDLLAIVVAVVAFCISGIFLLFLVPDRGRDESMEGALPAPILTHIPEFAGAPVQLVSAVDAEFGRGTYSPLGGAGGPPPRLARHLPIERDGATKFIAVEDVVAVHANAHYTYIFNGTSKLFCPLAIGEVESRLDKGQFVRIHRSHIINIARVVGYRRIGESEMVEMAAAEHYAVPVSRSRVNWLKSRISAKTG
jgi:hypothetical protein